jgi:hypothetical protein
MHKARETLLKHMGKVPPLPLKDQTDGRRATASEPRTGDLDATR